MYIIIEVWREKVEPPNWKQNLSIPLHVSASSSSNSKYDLLAKNRALNHGNTIREFLANKSTKQGTPSHQKLHGGRQGLSRSKTSK